MDFFLTFVFSITWSFGYEFNAEPINPNLLQFSLVILSMRFVQPVSCMTARIKHIL